MAVPMANDPPFAMLNHSESDSGIPNESADVRFGINLYYYNASTDSITVLKNRQSNRAELNAIVEAWTRQRGKHEVMRLMGDAGIPCGACQDTGEVLADPHLKAREMIVDVDYPTRGTYQTVGCPIKLSDSPVAVSRPPLLGEHTDVLLESLCGVEPDEAKRLRQEGVV